MRTSILFFVLGSAILSIIGCKKDAPLITNGSTSNPAPRPTPTSKDSIPPMAGAGSNVFVFLPAGSCELHGWAYSPRNGVEKYMWRKISGPSSYKINNPDSFWTIVNDLTRGVYEFELTAIDKVGLKDADTLSVTVGEMSGREISIKNISWSSEGLVWGAGLTVKNIYSYIPVGSDFKVFIRKDISGGWVEAEAYTTSRTTDAWHIFYITGSDLSVYSNYEEWGTADIMLVY